MKTSYKNLTDEQVKEMIKTTNTLIATFGDTPGLKRELKELMIEQKERKVKNEI